MLTILLFIDCSKMVRIRINTRNHTKEKQGLETIPDKFVFSFKIGKAKKVNRVSKIHVCMRAKYVQKEFL